jgi:poly-gamma-glutamate synthesis protein (capsule biosynthesis protein)
MIKILFAGDFSPKYKAKHVIENNPSILGEIYPLCESADYAIVNLECPILETVDGETKLEKCGPHLWNKPDAVKVLHNAGFNCVVLANNHIKDYSSKGIANTIEILNKQGFSTTGAGLNITEARKPLILGECNKKVCVINCCEYEYSIATSKSAGANPLDLVNVYNDIQEAKKQNTYVVVVVHGGIEGYQLPTPRMQKSYRFFIDAGANAVINHHQHCYSGYENYHNGLIFYGLGNLYFDTNNRDDKWTTGYMVSITFGESLTFELHPYSQCTDDECTFRFFQNNEIREFKSYLNSLNDIIQTPGELQREFNKFADKHEIDYADSLFPFESRIIKYLHRKGFLPDILARSKWLYLRDMFTCDSHYERYLRMINNKLKK